MATTSKRPASYGSSEPFLETELAETGGVFQASKTAYALSRHRLPRTRLTGCSAADPG